MIVLKNIKTSMSIDELLHRTNEAMLGTYGNASWQFSILFFVFNES